MENEQDGIFFLNTKLGKEKGGKKKICKKTNLELKKKNWPSII